MFKGKLQSLGARRAFGHLGTKDVVRQPGLRGKGAAGMKPVTVNLEHLMGSVTGRFVETFY